MFQGEKLRRMLERHRWTEREAERQLTKMGYRVTQSTLSEIISGAIVNPQPRTVEKLSKAFKVEKSYWYYDDTYLPDEIPNFPKDVAKELLNSEFIPYAVILREAIEKGLSEADLKMLLQVWTQTKGTAAATTPSA
jgi:transcriptional regulator with XRE-family HTH domain